MSRSEAGLRAMVLAAGYGTRLAPITDHAPKSLLPVGGVVLIDRIVASLDAAGVGPIAVNTHHLGGQVADHLRARPDADRFTLFPETEILGTGGALDGAREFLAAGDEFLLHNGDVLCDADLGGLLAAHRGRPGLATLLLVDWPRVNSVDVAADDSIVRIAGAPETPTAVGARSPVRSLTYSGVGVFAGRLLERIGPGFSSLIDPLVAALREDPGCVRAWVPGNVAWSDLGTLPRWLEAQAEFEPGETDGATGPVRLERIAGHGSSRRFWRIATPDWSAVAMQDVPGTVEFDRQVEIARWLDARGCRPPRLLDVRAPERVLLMEDLGDIRLAELAAESVDRALEASRRALDLVLRLHSLTGRAADECPAAADRVLDRAALRAETEYFQERFLEGHLGRTGADGDLQDEFERLADCVAEQPVVLIHRDFQSQNLHLDGAGLRPVDTQGMRRGPLGYDAASLVFDPYLDLGRTGRDTLLEYFGDRAETAHHRPADELRDMVLAAALQRLLQALGAYGFLGHVQGKPGFLEYIPAATARLREVLDRTDRAGRWLPGRLPRLRELAASLPD